MAYAICEAFGRQIMVKPGDEISVEIPKGDLTEAAEGTNENLSLDKVLLISEDKGVSIGTPYLQGRKVDLIFVRPDKGPKLVAFKFRRRKHSKSKKGYRSHLAVFKVKAIV